MNFNEFQQECTRTANPNINRQDANLNWALGIAGEAGEYCELIKKHTFHGKDLDLDDAKKELGDVLFYVAMAAKNLHLSLEEIAAANVEKLKRRYPAGFTSGGGIRTPKNNDRDDDGC
jgi:NTP pyrophosphatase (non-canonical NTP hydrolase)